MFPRPQFYCLKNVYHILSNSLSRWLLIAMNPAHLTQPHRLVCSVDWSAWKDPALSLLVAVERWLNDCRPHSAHTRDTQIMKQRPKASKYLVRLFRCWAASNTYTYVVLRGTPETRIPLIPCTSYLAAKSYYTLYGSLMSRRKESQTAWYHNMKNFAIQLMYG